MTRTSELIGPGAPIWQEVLTRVGHQVYHLPEYVSLDAAMCGGCPRAVVYEEDQGAWLLPLVVRPIAGTDVVDAVSPYGYPGPVSDRGDEPFWERAAASLVGTLAEQGVVSLFVRLDPLVDVPYRALERIGTLVTHGATVSIDLRLSWEQWWPEVRRDHRSAINRAVRLGRRSVMDDWSQLHAFVSIYHETMTRVGARDDYFFDVPYLEQLRDALGGRMHLLTVLAGDEPIAGSIYFESSGVMQAHLAATKESHRREEISRFLVSEGARWGREHGCTVLHLGGGVGGRQDSVFHFKKGFSRRRHDFRTLRAVLDPGAYWELTRTAGAAPASTDLAGYFPAYRRPADPAVTS